MMRGRSMVDRWAHNPEVARSSRVPATTSRTNMLMQNIQQSHAPAPSGLLPSHAVLARLAATAESVEHGGFAVNASGADRIVGLLFVAGSAEDLAF